MTKVFIGLGSNLGGPVVQLPRAVRMLHALPETAVSGTSPAYWSLPWGVVDQPEFLNAVVRLDTALSARDLLDRMQAIEAGQGRRRSTEVRWGPRSLDLDLLVFGDQTIAEPGLQVPHPRLAARSFVVVPLADLEPDLVIPGHGRVAEMARAIDRSGLRRAAVNLDPRPDASGTCKENIG